VFVDDNPVECAEVRGGCPEVLILELPAEDGEIPRALDHFWAFDRLRTTREDRERTVLYRQMLERDRHRRTSGSLQEFLESLGLVIDITPMIPAQLARVAQLTQRTNQFNASTIRRTEGEIQRLMAAGELECWTVTVSDRFGDYGLVGAALYELAPGRLGVDSLLLSCRALGRGVEHAMAAWLGRQALAEGRAQVEFAYHPTQRNQPAQDFIAALGGPKPGATAARWAMPAAQLASLTYTPTEEPAPERAPQAPVASAWDFAAEPERLQAIAQELSGVDRITQAIEARRQAPLAEPAPSQLAEAGSLEAALADIWARVLGRARVGLNDNFFDAGGTSLKAVRVVALVKKELGRALQVVSLLECPTVALLAARLEARPTAPGAGPGEAARRGQRRRQHLTGMRAA